jgi:hypothetical protein
MRPLTRIEPAGPAQAYKTYAVAAPSDRLVVTACEDAGCLAWRHGWETVLDESTDLGRAQADYIRQQSGRTFTESNHYPGRLTVFRFASRQRCFAEHRTRPVTFSVRRGDWRGDFGLIRRFGRGADFVEDFGEHQQRLADQLERG